MELWSSGKNVDMKVDSKSSQLGAVSTWMGDLIRILTDGFDIYSFFVFFFSFLFFSFSFLFHFIDLLLYFLLLISIALSVCLLFIFKGTGGGVEARYQQKSLQRNKIKVND